MIVKTYIANVKKTRADGSVVIKQQPRKYVCKGPKEHFTTEQLDTIEHLNGLGVTHKKIAAKLGVSVYLLAKGITEVEKRKKNEQNEQTQGQ